MAAIDLELKLFVVSLLFARFCFCEIKLVMSEFLTARLFHCLLCFDNGIRVQWVGERASVACNVKRLLQFYFFIFWIVFFASYNVC